MVQDEKERESYLILIVHGIGSNAETQQRNKAEFEQQMRDLIKGGYVKSDYTFEVHVVDWKTLVDSSDMRQRMTKVQTQQS